MSLCRQSLATTRHNTVGDREQSTAAEVIAVQARLASLAAAAAQPKARRAELAAAGRDRSRPGRTGCGNRRQEREPGPQISMRAADGCRDRTASLSARRSTNTRPLIDGVAADPPCGMVGSEVCQQVGRLQGGRKCESGEGPRVGRPEKHCLDGASKSRSMIRQGATWLSACTAHHQTPTTETSFQVVSSQPTVKRHPRSLRTYRQAAGVAPRVLPQVLAHGGGFEVGVAS